MTTPPTTPGRVVSITPLPKIEATEVELSNGIVIAFQRSTRRKEHIAFQGFGENGTTYHPIPPTPPPHPPPAHPITHSPPRTKRWVVAASSVSVKRPLFV